MTHGIEEDEWGQRVGKNGSELRWAKVVPRNETTVVLGRCLYRTKKNGLIIFRLTDISPDPPLSTERSL